MPNKKRLLEFRGKSQGISEWAAETGIPAATLHSRLMNGWGVEDALSKIPDKRFRKGGRPKAGIPRACPKLRVKDGDRCYVRWSHGTKTVFLTMGVKGEEANQNYLRFQRQWAQGVYAAGLTPKDEGVSVSKLVLLWLARCEKEYVKRGKITSEVHLVRSACRPLVKLFGDKLAEEMDIPAMDLVRAEMLSLGWARETINAQLARISRMFAWGARQKLLPRAVAIEVEEVDYVVAGRTTAAEPKAKKPVTSEHVEAVMPHLHPKEIRRAVFEDMIRFQILTGLRSQELCGMRVRDLDRTDPIWVYQVTEFNKMLHKEQSRRCYLGPKAQAILARHIEACGGDHDLPIFRLPAWRKRTEASTITTDRYRAAIARACELAGIPLWTPHQLRHNRATNVMRAYESDEAVGLAIGDTPEVARQVYVDSPGDQVARRIAMAMG
jgi:integrase